MPDMKYPIGSWVRTSRAVLASQLIACHQLATGSTNFRTADGSPKTNWSCVDETLHLP
jgi:hypothetical protein